MPRRCSLRPAEAAIAGSPQTVLVMPRPSWLPLRWEGGAMMTSWSALLCDSMAAEVEAAASDADALAIEKEATVDVVVAAA